jgi:hypothetical protein
MLSFIAVSKLIHRKGAQHLMAVELLDLLLRICLDPASHFNGLSYPVDGNYISRIPHIQEGFKSITA